MTKVSSWKGTVVQIMFLMSSCEPGGNLSCARDLQIAEGAIRSTQTEIKNK